VEKILRKNTFKPGKGSIRESINEGLKNALEPGLDFVFLVYGKNSG
jgi:hypothetical protein